MPVREAILDIFISDSKKKEFKKAVEQIIGGRPANLSLYYLAFRHTSASTVNKINGYKESNERLEYLGDSVLGMVVAEYLFKKYPFKDEGFLTEIRSRLVNRESLNGVARRLGLDKMITFDGNKVTNMRTSMYGDAMEALIGAIYLDRGFSFTKKFITATLLSTYYDLDAVIQNNTNYKSLLLTWAQAEGKKVSFDIIKENGKNHSKEFIAQVTVDDEVLGKGGGWNKKKAEQDAARKACDTLQIEG